MDYGVQVAGPGIYKFSMYSFIHCANLECENANDYILIRSGEGGTLKDLYKIDKSKNRTRDEKWVLDEFYFTINIVVRFYVRYQTFNFSLKTLPSI